MLTWEHDPKDANARDEALGMIKNDTDAREHHDQRGTDDVRELRA